MTVALRLRMLPRFPARITGTDGVKVVRVSGSPDLTVSLDFSSLGDIAGIPDAATNYFAMYDTETGAYYRIPFQSMFDATGVSAGYPTRAAAELANIPFPTHAIYLFGDATVGDGEGGLFIDTNNGNPDTFVSGDARTWYRAPDIGVDRLTSANLIELSAVNPGTAGKAVLAAETASAAGVAAGQAPYTANTMMIDNAAGTAREAKSFADVRKALDLSFLPNYSTPSAVVPFPIYITSTGTDTTGGDINHGSTELTAFATWQAALEHAKVLAKFYGRLSTVELRFGPGSWGIFALGSNLDQGEEFYDFAIHVTSIDNTNRAQFTAFSNGCWLPTYMYAYQIDAAYYVVTRRNAMTVNDCCLTNSAVISYAFRAAFGGKLNIFGDINVKNAVSYATAFIYCQDGGYVSLENGDTPSIFPVFNLIGAGNVTSSLKYRFVLGSGGYIPAVPYPQLTFATNYHVDSSSYSTQTVTAQDLANNAAIGGPIVARSGSSVTGTERYADGKFRQWGILSVTSAAVGQSSPASGLLTFPTAFGANPRIRYNWSVPAGGDVSVNAPQPGTTSVQFVVTNRGAGTASFSIYWEASGLL